MYGLSIGIEIIVTFNDLERRNNRRRALSLRYGNLYCLFTVVRCSARLRHRTFHLHQYTALWLQTHVARSTTRVCGQVNSALHPSGVAKSSTSFGWGKGGKVTSAQWQQVTLCDLIWHVISRSGVVISITNCYIRFTLLYFTYSVCYRTIQIQVYLTLPYRVLHQSTQKLLTRHEMTKSRL